MQNQTVYTVLFQNVAWLYYKDLLQVATDRVNKKLVEIGLSFVSFMTCFLNKAQFHF
jgi:hypothetical protein